MSITKQRALARFFTPAELASLLARRLVGYMPTTRGSCRILDPACGDGNLLVAIARELPSKVRSRCTLIGIEQEADSFDALLARISALEECHTDVMLGDF